MALAREIQCSSSPGFSFRIAFVSISLSSIEMSWFVVSKKQTEAIRRMSSEVTDWSRRVLVPAATTELPAGATAMMKVPIFLVLPDVVP